MLKRKGEHRVSKVEILLTPKRRVLVKRAGSGENGQNETGDSADGLFQDF